MVNNKETAKQMYICNLCAEDVIKNLNTNYKLLVDIMGLHLIDFKDYSKLEYVALDKWKKRILRASVTSEIPFYIIIDSAISLGESTDNATSTIISVLKKVCKNNLQAIQYLIEAKPTIAKNKDLGPEIENKILARYREKNREKIIKEYRNRILPIDPVKRVRPKTGYRAGDDTARSKIRG